MKRTDARWHQLLIINEILEALGRTPEEQAALYFWTCLWELEIIADLADSGTRLARTLITYEVSKSQLLNSGFPEVIQGE